MFFSFGLQEASNFGMFSLVCYHDFIIEVQLLVFCVVLVAVVGVMSFNGF